MEYIIIAALAKYNKTDRVVIQFDKNEYYIGTVSSVRNNRVYVLFDDGDKDNMPIKSKRIMGIGVNKKRKLAIKKKDLEQWIKDDTMKEKPINLANLKKNPKKYVKTLVIKQLVKLLDKFADTYYNTGNSLVSDSVYDIVEDELRTKDPSNIRLKQIGAPVKKGKGKIRLPYHMPSLDKIKSADGTADKWLATHEGPYVTSDKMDGASLMLVGLTNKWNMFTRGDGTYGGDLSVISPYLKLPKPKKGVVVRVEGLMKSNVFDKYYKDEAENPRNFTNGFFNPSRTSVPAGIRNADIMGFEVIKPKLKPSDQFKLLKTLGFKVAPHKIYKTIDPSKLTKILIERKKKSGYDIDGIVVAQDIVANRTSSNPDHKKAFKSPSDDQMATVTVTKVDWTLSKYGFWKPRVWFEGVRIGGVTVKKATGFNAYFIKYGHRKDQTDKPNRPIGKGSVIKIIRSGDVIPHIVEVLKKGKLELPKGKFEWTDSGIDIFKTDKKGMESVEIKMLNHFFRNIGVEYFSEKLVARCYNDGLNTIMKIVKASPKRLLKIDGIQDTMANKIRDGIDNQLEGITISDLMFASGSFGKDMGSRRIKLIMDKYPKILSNDYDDIVEKSESVAGIQTTLAELFAIGVPKFNKFMTKIDPYVSIVKPKKLKLSSTKLSGITVAFTGVRSAELESKIVKNGGTIGSGVSKNTTHLIVKDLDSGSAKLNKAKDLGIKIMTIEKFKKSFKL